MGSRVENDKDRAQVEARRESIAELWRLMADNPGVPVLAMVDSDVCCGEEYGRWCGTFGRASLERAIDVKEHDKVGFRFYDPKAPHYEVESVLETLLGFDAIEGTSVEDDMAAYEALPWEPVILVNIDLPY